MKTTPTPSRRTPRRSDGWDETRFRILDRLVAQGARSAAKLRESLGIESNTLHDHLDVLVDVGLVENRKRSDADSEGVYSYYRATSLGEGILTPGLGGRCAKSGNCRTPTGERDRPSPTRNIHNDRRRSGRVSPTVHALRNEIRVSVGRYERRESTSFTKEALAAICEDVGYDADTAGRPSKPRMRAGILWTIGERDDDAPEDDDRPFRKADLEAIAAALRDE